VYSRAELSRTVSIVAALFLTAISTSAAARDVRAADTHKEDYPTVQTLQYRPVHFMREKWKALEEGSRQQAKAAGVTIGPTSTASPSKQR
jgi:hypothetical protein